ncbi:hypothetical protein A2229_01330 [Candidatus Peregrinibacteria bacterium RIFOXYA2_FULL_33_7]|nr:MAG: hypothetical protein A2229_01330 [Candidatus Peregrinibacteria bacterium RIFOXYA2_FULL_33_7]
MANATVFFKVSTEQDKEIKELMKEEGYQNKAEFFRFLVKFFKYNRSTEEMKLKKATMELAAVLRKLDKEDKFGSSIDEQLSDV